MAITITVDNDRTTTPPNPPFDPLLLDETAGVQTPATTDDGNEINVTLTAEVGGSLSGFATAFNTFLNSASLGLTDAQKIYARDHDGASSASNFVLVTTSAGETIDDLFFANATGGVLAGVQVVGMKTLDGQDVYLWSDGNFGSSGDFCVATTSPTAGAGEVVAAFYLNEAADHKSAQVQMVVFEPLEHNNDGLDPDDALNFTDALRVGATGSLSFDFDQLASSSSLWVAVGNSSEAVLVTGSNPDVNNTTGKKTNASDVIHTSQGGAGATIGVNNQLFDNAGESATFTLVTGMTDLVGSDDGVLSDYVIDDAGGPGIEYGGYIPNVTGAGIFISQDQGSPNATKSLDINVFATNNAGEEEGFGYVYSDGVNKTGDALTDDTAVNVTTVSITDSNGALVGTWVLGADPDGAGPLQANGATAGGVQVTITGNNIDVNNFGIQYTISWTTTQAFNRFNVVNEAGKWDIGRVDVDRTVPSSTPVGDKLFVEDDGPAVNLVLSGTAEVRVDESTLPAIDSIIAADLFSTNTANFGTDGPGADDSAYKLVLGPDPDSGLFDTLTQDEVILSINGAGTLITGSVNAGADVVFTIAIDPDTGEVTLTQSRAMINGDITDPDESDTPLELEDGAVSVQRTITDGDNDSASDTVDISSIFKFEDAGPTQPGPSQDPLELTTDDTGITAQDTLSTDDIFPGAPSYGSDGPHPTNPLDFVLRLVTDNGDSGLIDTATGKAIRFKTVGSDIVGFVDANGDGVIGAGETLEAVRYSLTFVDADSETVTFTQSRAIFHAIADTEDTVNTNLVFVDRVAIDGDGDPAQVVSYDLGEVTHILDDEPSIGPVANGLVDFEINDFVTGTLNGVVGNDPNSAPYILTAFTPSLVVNGVTVQAVPAGDNQSVTYWANSNGNGVFGDAGDTAYYRMVLNEAGAGSYTFTVLIDPPPAFTEFRFDDLPSGSNLFGIVGDADAGLIIFGETIGLKADNTYIANQTQEVKTSQAGLHDTIGIESQMFDPGDAAYFTFVNDPDANFTGTALGSTEADDADNILYGSTLENDSAFIRIAQLQGNTDPSMSIQLFNIDDDDPQGVAMLNARGINEAGKDPDVIAVRVYDALGNLLEDTDDLVNFDDPDIAVSFLNGVATVTGFDTDYKVEWDADEDFDQTLITGVAGKFDIGGFGFLQGDDTPDQLLEFTAQVTDGDADTDSASWTIGIDGTGIYDDNFVTGLFII